MKRPNEEHARSSFHAWFMDKVHPRDFTWREVSQEEEPPDYFLETGGDIFAVEVTLVLPHIELNGKRIPSKGVRKGLAQFVERVGEIAKRHGLLRGVYLISARPITNLPAVEADLELGLLDYISCTRDWETSPIEEVTAGTCASMSIRKIGMHKDYVAPMTSIGARGEAEEMVDLTYVLTERISEKRRKLKNIDKPTILLLVDGLHVGTDEDWLNRIPQTDAKEFHSICRITVDGGCTAICSVEKTWLSRLP